MDCFKFRYYNNTYRKKYYKFVTWMAKIFSLNTHRASLMRNQYLLEKTLLRLNKTKYTHTHTSNKGHFNLLVSQTIAIIVHFCSYYPHHLTLYTAISFAYICKINDCTRFVWRYLKVSIVKRYPHTDLYLYQLQCFPLSLNFMLRKNIIKYLVCMKFVTTTSRWWNFTCNTYRVSQHCCIHIHICSLQKRNE